MLSLVGKDQPGIVAKISTLLYEHDAQLGEASMQQLAGNFAIMLMVGCKENEQQLRNILASTTKELNLHLHIDKITSNLHNHQTPNVRATVYGADRTGIVSQITSKLAESGLNIINLDSSVTGDDENKIYLMQLEGIISNDDAATMQKLQELKENGVELHIEKIDALVG